MAKAVALPNETTIPRRTLRRARLSMVIDGDRLLRGRGLRSREGEKERIAVASECDGTGILHHAVDLERDLEIDLHLLGWRQNAIGDRVATADAAVGRI